MKKIGTILSLFFMSMISFAQQKEEAENLVTEGIAYHEKGDFEGAIARYDKALELDKNNLFALYEKAFSLMDLQKYEEAIQYCQKAIEHHPDDKILRTVYVTYGNAYDALKKTDQSIEIYDKGIKQFPDFYLLYFNKGITLTSVKKYDEAIECFQKSAIYNPEHASSHNAIAWILDITGKRIPSILAYCRFLVLEPEGNRAKRNLDNLKKLINENVEQTGKKSINISIPSQILNDTTTENNFSSTELILTMSSALNYDKKNIKKTETEKFIKTIETLCSSLKEVQNKNQGFYWDYYVPYFIEMYDLNLLTPFSYIVYASSNDPKTLKWITSHKKDIEVFYKWSDQFKWETK